MYSFPSFHDETAHKTHQVLDPWNVVLGLAVLMLARILGMLYIKNNIEHQSAP